MCDKAPGGGLRAPQRCCEVRLEPGHLGCPETYGQLWQHLPILVLLGLLPLHVVQNNLNFKGYSLYSEELYIALLKNWQGSCSLMCFILEGILYKTLLNAAQESFAPHCPSGSRCVNNIKTIMEIIVICLICSGFLSSFLFPMMYILCCLCSQCFPLLDQFY